MLSSGNPPLTYDFTSSAMLFHDILLGFSFLHFELSLLILVRIANRMLRHRLLEQAFEDFFFVLFAKR